jgi:hypothetical protein
MNIFVVDHDPCVAAQMLGDQHICKMSIETPQLLSAAHHRWHANEPHTAQLYKLTHKNHPSTLWTGAHPEHYEWVFRHACALWDEYEHRYGRPHASSRLRHLLDTPPRMYGYAASCAPPQCMPDQYKVSSAHTLTGWTQTVQAYRQYYIGEKLKFARWNRSAPPSWCTVIHHAA